jgi:hypothetical protein
MKRVKLAFAFFLLLGAGTSGVAWADHFHYGPRVGIVIGVPLGRPWYYPPPYYYYPAPVVAAPSAPPAYVEQDPVQAPMPAQPQAGSNGSDYWYYCSNPDGYYPYIKQCPGGWQRVVPQPPPRS